MGDRHERESQAIILDSDSQPINVLEAFEVLRSLRRALDPLDPEYPMDRDQVVGMVDRLDPDIARKICTLVSTACRLSCGGIGNDVGLFKNFPFQCPTPLKSAGVPAFSKAYRS
jgi:hypothetical protein